jgi:hypothetical protein
MTVEYSSQHTDEDGDRSADVGAELIESNRRARADLRTQLAEAEKTLGEIEHSVEERMLSVADMLPDTQDVRRRAHRLSAAADSHLARAARKRSEIGDAPTGSGGEEGPTQ